MKPFRDMDLSAVIAEQKRKIKIKVEGYTNDEIMANDIDLLADNIYSEFFIDPITIYEEEVRKRSIQQAKVKKWIHPFMRIDPNREYVEVDGIVMKFYFRYNGERDLFKCQASTFSVSGYPEIGLDSDFISFTYQKTLQEMENENAKDNLLKEVEKDLKSIRDGIGYANRDIASYNDSIRGFAKTCIEERKKKVQSFFELTKLFEVPIEKTEYAKECINVKRTIVPIAHEYEKREKEYCISDKDYQDILYAIKHTGSTFERTPNSYRAMGEEDLRNVLLASLNLAFKGDAVGEAFRNKGKTDICIERENRAAFVAECKMWTGAKDIEKAIKQLDGYLTWRDSKTALIYFVRRKDFIKVCNTVEKTLKELTMIRQITSVDKNEFCCEFASENAVGQLISMRVFLFNMDADN